MKGIFFGKSIIAAAALLVLVVGCGGGEEATPTSQPTLAPPPTVLLATATSAPVEPTTAPTVAPTQAAPTDAAPVPNTEHPTNLGETKTYSDAEAGFELDYPADWNMTPIGDDAKKNSTIYAVTIYSYPARVSGEGIPPGESKMDIAVFKNGAESVQAAVDLRKQEFANSGMEQKVLREEIWTLASGLQAVHMQVSDHFGESSEVITTLNGKTILLGGVGDYAVLDAIAQTLRPLE